MARCTLVQAGLLPVSLLLSAALFAAEEYPGIEKLMSGEEFQRAGLQKQTPEELLHLSGTSYAIGVKRIK